MEWNPREKYTTLVNRIQTVLEDGTERTTRDIYYALESRGYDYDYDSVKRAVKKGRRAGMIDPSQIVDTSRSAELTAPETWETPEAFVSEEVQGAERAYARDAWEEMDTHVEVWVEKASLASLVASVAAKWNVRVEATRGDWSDSKVARAAQRLMSHIDAGEDVRILYLGDYNPSGFRAPVSIQETMRHYGLSFRKETDSSHPLFFECWPRNEPVSFGEAGGSLSFERVALNTSHIRQYDLPENPTPRSQQSHRTLSKRFRTYVTDGTDRDVELNALREFHEEDFRAMINDAIRQHVDIEVWNRVRSEELTEREQVGEMIQTSVGGPEGVYDSLDDAVAAAVNEVAADADAPVVTAGSDGELTVVVDHVDTAGIDQSRIVSTGSAIRFVSATTDRTVGEIRVSDGVPGVAVVGGRTVAVIDSNPLGGTVATTTDGSVADRYRDLRRDAEPFGDDSALD